MLYRYEGTGRSLSLKLIEQLRVQNRPMATSSSKEKVDSKVLGRTLAEVSTRWPFQKHIQLKITLISRLKVD